LLSLPVRTDLSGSCEVRCARDIEDLIRTSTSGRIAGFIAEPIQGVGGFITPPKEYFAIVADIVRQSGGIFISDEVQTAWGRTGNKWFGIEHYGVTFPMSSPAPKAWATVVPSESLSPARGGRGCHWTHHLHLRRQPGCHYRRQSRLDLIEEENLLANCRRDRRLPARRKLEELRTNTRSSAMCAAWASCRRSNWWRIARPKRPPPAPPPS
jgi:hypothetical protein